MGITKKVKEKYSLLVDRKEFQEAIRSVGYNMDMERESIVAMAYSRKDAMRKLEDLHTPIAVHLLKVLVLLPSHNTDVLHWEKELKAWQEMLKRYNKGKLRSGKNYSRKDLLHWLWECPLGTLRDREFELKFLRENYKNVPKTVDEKKLKKAVVEFIDGVLVKK